MLELAKAYVVEKHCYKGHVSFIVTSIASSTSDVIRVSSFPSLHDILFALVI